MRAAPPTAEDLARLDAQTKTALDSILTGTTQSRTSLEREFPALSKASEPFKTFDEPDHVAGEKLSFLEAEKAIARDKAEMDATAESIYREAMREDEERTEHLKTGTSGGRLSLYEADPPPYALRQFCGGRKRCGGDHRRAAAGAASINCGGGEACGAARLPEPDAGTARAAAATA